MLAAEALAISHWKKKLVWGLAQHRALAAADCLHATAVSEYEEIRAAGLINPVAIIPNGIDLPELEDRCRRDNGKRTVLYLGRMHPKKGLVELVRAWALIENEFPDASLRLVGPAEGQYDEELRKQISMLLVQRVAIDPPVFGHQAKLAAYRAADIFVLPTRNENFGMTVAEALAAEVPVITTKGAPWSGLAHHRCGWWIEFGVEALAAALREALAVPHGELHAMGEQGRRWMSRDFGWGPVAEEMAAVYGWLQTGGEAPPTVRFH
jgi:glycosyltransferase involved in cell wall biosynthesis